MRFKLVQWLIVLGVGLIGLRLSSFHMAGPALTGAEPVILLTATPSPTSSPVPTLAVTSTPQITSSGPADLEVLSFVFERHPPQLGTLTEEFLDKVAAGQYGDFNRQDVDLDGNSQPEILVSGQAEGLYLYLAILTRDPAGALREILYTDNVEGKYCAEVRTTVEPERVVADFLTCTGGTGFLVQTWEQRWIECQAGVCHLVWSAPLLQAERAVNWTIQRRYTLAEVVQPDPETIQMTTHRFGLTELPVLDAGAPPGTTRRVIGPDTLMTYRRMGDLYQLESRTQLTSGTVIAREFDLLTQETIDLVYHILIRPFERADGSLDMAGFDPVYAAFWGLPASPDDATWGPASRQPDVAAHNGPPEKLGEWVAGLISANDRPLCRLTVQHRPDDQFELAGQIELPCTVNFTRLAWVDMDDDGQVELLLQTIPPDIELAGNIERLYVYAVDDTLTELATLDGVINGPDGIGVRWEKLADRFNVYAGLPLADLDHLEAGWASVSLERRFQIYTWDEENNRFQAEETP